jgi:hypothetical protein
MNTVATNISSSSISSQNKLHWNFFDISIYLHFFIPSFILFKEPFEFYITYTFIILYLPFLAMKYPIPRGVWWILIILLLTGILNVWLDNNTYKNFFKIYINIVINLIFYGLMMAYYNYNVEEMFRRYLKGVVIVCIYGIIELVAYKLGAFSLVNLRNLGFNKWGLAYGGLGIRVNATYPEPAHLAQFISPAVFVAFYNLFVEKIWLSKWESIIIIITFLLTFSSLAYTGLFIILILFLLNYGLIRYFIIAVPIGIFLAYIVYTNVNEFRDRIDGLKLLFIDEYLLEEKNKEVTSKNAFEARQLRVLRNVHGSSLVLYNNYYVAMQNFKTNFLFGTGLGSHEIAFQKYNLNYLLSKWYVLNAPDANSMGLRIISELGLLGIIFTLFFIIKFLVLKSDAPDNKKWILSGAIFIIIIIQLLRQGNYTFSGFFFFPWLYYYNALKN